MIREMIPYRVARGLRSAVPLAVGLSLLLSGAVHGAATVQTFGYPPTPFAEILPNDPTVCGMGTDDGFLSGTHELSGRYTQTDNGREIHATETFIYRVDLPLSSVYGPGSYILGSSVAHFAFTQHAAVTTFANTVSDHGDVIYSAAGEVIGSAAFQLVEHITSFDLGAPGPSPEDRVIVNFDRFSITCS